MKEKGRIYSLATLLVNMEKKRTAMQELMEWMIEESQVIPVDPGNVYQKAKELLLMEKEQIKKAYQGNWSEILSDESEEYYNETYKQQDNG